MSERVLVTGASGFVGGHVILQLLEKGYEVRGTVRNLGRADKVRATLARAAGSDPGSRLSFAAADLSSDDGWAAAVDGCAYVQHVASPFPSTVPKHEDELIIPARDGAVRVVRAAGKAGVKRVVITSSIAAVAYGAKKPKGHVYTEADWTDPTHPDADPYPRSKTIAEKAAFAAAKETGVEIASINPSGILGPVLDEDLSTSIELIKRPLTGKMPGAPRLSFGVVDVRDVADAHLRAMTAPGAANERFLATGGTLWMKQLLEVLARAYPDRKIKTQEIPDIVMRVIAMFDPVLRGPVHNLGKYPLFSTKKAETVLGWKARPDEESILSTAESLIRLKIV